MRIIITFHAPIEERIPSLYHQFGFTIDRSDTKPWDDVVTLRTAQVLLPAVHPDSAFSRMLLAICSANAADYDQLVGLVFREQQQT